MGSRRNKPLPAVPDEEDDVFISKEYMSSRRSKPLPAVPVTEYETCVSPKTMDARFNKPLPAVPDVGLDRISSEIGRKSSFQGQIHLPPRDAFRQRSQSETCFHTGIQDEPDEDYLEPRHSSCKESDDLSTSNAILISGPNKPLPPLPLSDQPEITPTAERIVPIPKPRPKPTMKQLPTLNGIERQYWYFDIDRMQADNILTRNGQYLVRPSKTGGATSPYVLCVFHCVRVYHLQIRREDGRYLLGAPHSGQKTFSKVPDIIRYHKIIPIFLASKKDEPIYLVETPSRDGIYDFTA